MSILLSERLQLFSQQDKFYSYKSKISEIENPLKRDSFSKFTVFGQITYKNISHLLISKQDPQQVPVRIKSYKIIPKPPFLLSIAVKSIKHLLYFHPNPPRQFFATRTAFVQFPCTLMHRSPTADAFFVSALYTRFFRGLVDGHPVNTIQVHINTQNGVFELHRGSIPLLFEQRPGLKFTPKIEIGGSDFGFRLDQKIRPISLLSGRGGQLALSEAFSGMYPNTIKIDLHRATQLELAGFCADYVKGVLRVDVQREIPRINCLDCIDRTGVLQSEFYSTLGGDRLDSFRMNYVFSRLYVGTCQQKLIQNLTGRKMCIDKFFDGYLALVRYFKNRFISGVVQGLYDILNEKHHVNIMKQLKIAVCFISSWLIIIYTLPINFLGVKLVLLFMLLTIIF
ncbi:hypothetical protein SS50377_25763 [Spironucleus salmonicida]|uniref:SAC domain-containing protein n=1 Tax=Spironucleus salmonicida TaxID=348837 RepID=V6M4K0_9EUKA|nr:hypothetical protein SS50377_25763 [Spironucleus salmonicida]|eukprot:EST48259.1 hypothetical protein SS50377_11601 [Spironucleus salmonicida]